MSQISAAPLPPPRGAVPKAPVKRLATLKKPIIPTPIRRPQAHAQTAQQQHPPKPTTHPKTATCPNQGCSSPEIVEDDGKKVCAGCGTVISEANIVSEVSFGESSSGAAVVHGTFVGAGQSHGRSFGPGFQRGGGMESREITEQNGNRYINQLSRALNVAESATKAAGQVFKLAVGLNFIQGRRTKTVAAVCLYIACRRQENNTVMLIDFADVLMINVFKLGRAYKALLDELRLGGNVFLMNPVEPESLIYRFAKQLEFGSSMMQVAAEAVRIVQRMNRDWMITGRRPAGICGAALILAARMNNFRRTVREVVFVVKVTEVTIMQRLNEFKDTESGDLTVDQFRSVQLENSRDPPAFIQAREGKKSRILKKRKSGETAEDNEGDDSDESSQFSETPQPPSKRTKRVDADGFAIPDIPIDPALRDQNGNSNAKESTPDEASANSKAGRPKGQAFKVPPPTAAELAMENALEDEMTELLSSSSLVASSTQAPKKPVSSSTEVDSAEFESDPEVANCLLSPAEVEIKERIWVHENKDYLRTQQAKVLKRSLTEEPEGANSRSKPRKKRKGRMGDVGYLEGENGSRASTPAEATMLMLEKRGFSKKINYRMLEDLYGEEIVKGGSPSKKSKSSSQDPNSTAAVAGTDRRRSQSVARSREGSPRRSMSKSVEPEAAARRRSRTPRAATPAATPSARAPRAPRAPEIPAQPVKQPKAPEPPVDPNEEVLGYLPGYDEGEEDGEPELETGPPPALPDDDEDEDDDDDDDEDDGVEAAFAGNYYDEDSDGGGGYGDDDYY